jgi:glycosyltransferase EpsD
VKRVPHAHFVIVGSGDEHDTSHLKARASSLGISSNVHFLGFRGATASLIQCFSVLLSSSDSEGLPLSFLEAMATGIPIVATSNEGASSLLTDTKAGLLCPVRNESRLAEAVIELLENPFVARQMATNGRSAACDRYSLTRTLERYDELYRLALTEMRSVISG